MCGIVLLYNQNGVAPSSDVITRMTRALNHRGPDAQATCIRGPVALGHTRLSIVDVQGGAQPMISADGRYAIVFNGEIYNYRELRVDLEKQGVHFASASDTEVILHLYARDGAKCVLNLRGMFAFAIHDKNDNSVFLARDRVGIKPLFYHWNGATLFAASEMKAIFASGTVDARFDPAALRDYFAYQFAIAPHTPFADVYELKPGHTMSVTPDKAPVAQQYWDLHFPRDNEYESRDEAYWTRRFETALNESTACHTIGEVPIGSYLSAGIDSSTTTMLLTKYYDRPVQSFSIQFPNNDLDESSIYRKIAQSLNVGNTEVAMLSDGSRGYVDEMAQAIYHIEQPQRMALDIPYLLLSKLVSDNKYKVVYTGDGSDEILGGYDCYRQDYMRIWGNYITSEADRVLLYSTMYARDFAEPYVNMIYQLHDRAKQQRVTQRFGTYPVWYDFWQITADMMPGLFTPDFEQRSRASDAMGVLAEEMKPQLAGRHRINQSLYIETKTRLPGWILWRSDRMSMSHGVEARVPFLDHPLIELAARVPPDLKIRGMNEKYILKKVAMPHLPAHPWQFKKKAFYTPIREWLFTPAQNEKLEPYLSAEAIRDAGIFNVVRVNELRARILATKTPNNMNDYHHLMKLEWIMTLVLTIQMLHRQFVRKEGACFAR